MGLDPQGAQTQEPGMAASAPPSPPLPPQTCLSLPPSWGAIPLLTPQPKLFLQVSHSPRVAVGTSPLVTPRPGSVPGTE